MKNAISIYISALSLLLLTASCTKVIDVKTGDDTGKLVIEANITNISGPQSITLTKNVPLSSTNTYPPETGATVVVTDQAGNNYPFTESQPGVYTINQLAGIAGNIYTMNVIAEGVTYIANSTMPTAVAMDSITYKNAATDDKKRRITVHYQDPAGVANQYRFVMFVNGVQSKTVFAANDQFNDGKYVNLDLFGGNTDIYSGDNVKIEMQCIDEPVYTYWYTLSQQNPNGPGGGVTPSDPPSNISPTSLGYFSAHTIQAMSVTVD